MRTPSILVISIDRAETSTIGYGVNDRYDLKYSLNREDATVFSSRAAAIRTAGHAYSAVPADATIIEIGHALWRARY